MTRRVVIDPVKRAAIWEAHDRRCMYTTEKIDVSVLAIDHLIPINDGGQTLARLRARNLVAANFDINGFENLIPTHGPRNRQKSEQVLEDEALVFFLQIARPRAERAAALYNELTERDRSLNGFLQLQAAAQRNSISVDDMFKVMKHQSSGEVVIRMAPAIEGEAIYSANSAVASELMDMPFSLAGANVGGVRLEGPGGEKLVAKTSNEFLAAKAADYSPITQYDINMWSWADATSETLKAVKNSRFATNSEIRFPLVSFENLDRWSAEWITMNAVEEVPASHAACASIAQLLAGGFAKLVQQGKWMVDIEYDAGLSTKLSELVRADLDNDGHEEILVNAVAYAPGGTLRAGSVQMAKMRDGILVPMSVPDTEEELGTGCSRQG
ncbi:hypothetical protein GCM10009434_24120 [Brevundimonas olei]